ncbi:MAG: anthranilate phosphoribosyltransferase, partial [Nitrososphaeria archaeon]
MNLSEMLEMLLKGKDLSITESSEIASAIIKGELTEAQTSAILVALRAKGESPDEIAGYAISMRNSSIRVGPWYDAVDTAGTGGDGIGTFNASTASAIIISRVIRVAKHGNRGVSSRSGSADFLEALGYNIIVRPEEAENLLRNSGFVFLFAQLYHPSMKNVAPVRKALGIRTIFNMLGPLTNPAGVKRQVVGVFSTKFMVPIAEAFVKLGAENIYLVHGHPGIDEVSVSGQTSVIKVKRKGYESFN